jgi:hypothetical protein
MLTSAVTSGQIQNQYVKAASVVSAANAPAVLTLTPASSKQIFVVHSVQYSLTAAPGGADPLTIVGSVGGTYLNLDLGGVGPFQFDCFIPSLPGETLTITLAAAGGTAVGKLNVQYQVVTTPTRAAADDE